MNQRIFYCLFMLLILGACGEKLDVIKAVNAVSIATGEITVNTQKDSIDAIGIIHSVGDGLNQHGHEISTSLDFVGKVSTESGNRQDAGNYISKISIDGTSQTYYVRAYVIDTHGRRTVGNTQSISIDIIKADFIIENNNCTAPCMVSFTSQSSSNAVTFEWDFGDDLTSNSPNPSHLYTTPDDYTVSLTASDNQGNSDLVSKTVTIRGTTFANLYAGFEPGRKVVELSSGGYVVAGENGSSIYLLKVSSEGEQGVSMPYVYSSQNRVGDLIQFGNRLVLTGSMINSADNLFDIFVVRTDPVSLAPLDTPPTRIGSENISETASAIIAVEGQLILLGDIRITGGGSDMLMAKFDNAISPIGQAQTISLPMQELSKDLILSPSNDNVMIAGTSFNPSTNRNSALYLISDSEGKTQGVPIIYGPNGNYSIEAASLAPNVDVWMCGAYLSEGSSMEDVLLMKIDPNGVINNVSDRMGSIAGRANDIEVLNDGSVVLAGVKNENAYLAKLTSSGDIVWERDRWGRNDSELPGFDFFEALQKTSDGGFIATGGSAGELLLVKTDHQGER